MASNYGENDIIAALEKAGIKSGDVIFTHGNIGFFGRAKSAATPEELYSLFKGAVFKVLGPKGSWVLPTFTYNVFNKQVFDPTETPSQMGMLNEAMRKDTESFRSSDPNFSVVALGAKAKQLTENAPAHSFGPHSFWERFLNVGGKFCNFNFDAGSTFVHYVEKMLNVPYRHDKAFTGTVIEDGRTVEKTVYHFVHDLDKPEYAADFRKLDAEAKKTGKAKTADLGRGQIVVISARDTFELIEEKLKIDPMFVTLAGAAQK